VAGLDELGRAVDVVQPDRLEVLLAARLADGRARPDVDVVDGL
jgi:hypothetical protein